MIDFNSFCVLCNKRKKLKGFNFQKHSHVKCFKLNIITPPPLHPHSSTNTQSKFSQLYSINIFASILKMRIETITVW